MLLKTVVILVLAVSLVNGRTILQQWSGFHNSLVQKGGADLSKAALIHSNGVVLANSLSLSLAEASTIASAFRNWNAIQRFKNFHDNGIIVGGVRYEIIEENGNGDFILARTGRQAGTNQGSLTIKSVKDFIIIAQSKQGANMLATEKAELNTKNAVDNLATHFQSVIRNYQQLRATWRGNIVQY